MAGATLLLPFTPQGRLFGFVPIPLPCLVVRALILWVSMLSAELVKRWVYRSHQG